MCPPFERNAASSLRSTSSFPTTAFSTSAMIFSEYSRTSSSVMSAVSSSIMVHLPVCLHPAEDFIHHGLFLGRGPFELPPQPTRGACEPGGRAVLLGGSQVIPHTGGQRDPPLLERFV